MTSIEWVKNADGSQGLTWNPIRGCTRVSPGCGGPGPHGGCYAEGIAARFSGPGQPYEGLAAMQGGKPRWTGKLAFVESALTAPLHRRKPTTWFVNSMSDLFHEKVPDAWIDRVFAVMALAHQHTFQVLTKRSARMRAYLTDPGLRHRLNLQEYIATLGMSQAQRRRHRCPPEWVGKGHPTPNVWLGVSAEDQRRADERVPDLLATPAAVRFVSAEPLLGPIDFTRIQAPWVQWRDALRGHEQGRPGGSISGGAFTAGLPRVDWIIVGGESGPKARPMHPAWARQIRDACAAAGVAFHFKQWGAFHPADQMKDGAQLNAGGDMGRALRDGRAHAFEDQWTWRLGKKAAGRLLDGVEHNGMPEVRHG